MPDAGPGLKRRCCSRAAAARYDNRLRSGIPFAAVLNDDALERRQI